MANALDFQLGLFSSAAALRLALSLGRGTAVTRSGPAEVSTLSEGIIRGSNQNNRAHVLLGIPLCGIGTVDGEGYTRSTFFPSSSFASRLRPLLSWSFSLPRAGTEILARLVAGVSPSNGLATRLRWFRSHLGRDSRPLRREVGMDLPGQHPSLIRVRSLLAGA